MDELLEELMRLRREHEELRDHLIPFTARVDALTVAVGHMLPLLRGQRDFVAGLQAAFEVAAEKARGQNAATRPLYVEAFEHVTAALTRSFPRD